MYFSDLVKLALRNISRERSRSFLTLLGVMIGMAAVVGLLSISGGLRFFISGTLNKLGSDFVVVMPGGSGMASAASTTSGAIFDESDLLAVKNVQGVKNVWGRTQKPYVVEFKDEQNVLMVASVDIENMEILKERDVFKVISGRMFEKNNIRTVVLPKEIAENTFKKKIRIGQTIYISDEPFKVIGIVEMPSGIVGQQVIFTQLQTAREIFDDDGISLMNLIVTGDAEVVSERIKSKLEHKRGDDDFDVSTNKDIVNAVGNIINIADVVLVGVAAISLAIGGLGIMNTMYMSISEKTREIGIMKALGATNRVISIMFTLEAGIVGLLGGIVGGIFGYILGKIVEGSIANALQLDFHIVITKELIIGVLLFSSILGMVAGILPVKEATKLKPVEAMR